VSARRGAQGFAQRALRRRRRGGGRHLRLRHGAARGPSRGAAWWRDGFGWLNARRRPPHSGSGHRRRCRRTRKRVLQQ
jgi:hypothetical protein